MKKISAVLSLLLVGCTTNPFSQFYVDYTSGAGVDSLPHVVLYQGNPQVFRGRNVEADNDAMLRDGYAMVGYSSFNAGNATEQQLLSQGKSVYAERIVLYSAYTNTVTGAVPITLPRTESSTTNVYGSVSGASGYGTFSGTGTTTTYGSKTTLIPYNVRRYDYLATYWVKLKPLVFGVSVRDLSNEERQAIQSNKGVVIDVVVTGSPAFMADLLKGDVLKRIGVLEVLDVATFMTAVDHYEGQSVQVEYIRNGKVGSAIVVLGRR